MDTALRHANTRRALATLGVVTGLGLCLLANVAAADTSADSTAATAHSDSAGAAISDAAITTKVKASYLGEDRLKGSHVKVTTTNGVVTLRGSALNADAKAAAEELAHNVDGVRSVDDELTTPASNGSMHKAVATTERAGSDSWITTKVKSEILADSVSKGFKVSVKTVNGVVMLHGTLANDDAIAHVKDLAQKVQGVKSVDTTQLKSAAS
jgi:hyperosmotically inducible periplasmic protein